MCNLYRGPFIRKVKLNSHQNYGNGVVCSHQSDVLSNGYSVMACVGVVIRATLDHRGEVPLLFVYLCNNECLANTPQETGKLVTPRVFPGPRICGNGSDAVVLQMYRYNCRSLRPADLTSR